LQNNCAKNWLANVSSTASSLRGNYAGLFRPETGQLDPNINSDFDIRSLLANRMGPPRADRTHQIKVYGAKDVVLPGGMALEVGLSYRARSGSPLNTLGSHRRYGADEIFVSPRASAGRSSSTHTIDAHLGYGIELRKESRLSLSVDVFNLFNFQ